MSAESALVKPPNLMAVSTCDGDLVIPTYFQSSTEGSTWLRVLRVYVSARSVSQIERSSDRNPPQTLSDRKQCCVLM